MVSQGRQVQGGERHSTEVEIKPQQLEHKRNHTLSPSFCQSPSRGEGMATEGYFCWHMKEFIVSGFVQY